MRYGTNFRCCALAALTLGAALAMSACGSGSSSEPPAPPDDAPADPPLGSPSSELIVDDPIRYRVAAPDIPIRAECRDARGIACEFTVSIHWDHDAHFASITSSINGTVDVNADLSGYDWHEGEVGFRAPLSDGRTIVINRYVYVEQSSALSRVTRVDGEILDVDGGRILYMQSTFTDSGFYKESRFFIRSLEDGGIVELSAPVDKPLIDDGYGWLTNEGALLVFRADTIREAIVIDAREEGHEVLATLEETEGTVAVSGDYAIWRSGRNLWRWTFSTKEALLVTDIAWPTSGDVMADGSVAYIAVEDHADPFVFRPGGTQRLANDDAQETDIRSDGEHFVYKKEPVGEEVTPGSGRLAVHDGVSEAFLVSDVEVDTLSYMIREGWVVYQWDSEDGSSPLWVTHVRGEPIQLGETSLGAIEALGNDGSVVTSGSGFRLRSAALGELQFSKHVEGRFEDASNTRRVAPSVRQLNGTWFFLLGDSLFAIRP